MLIAQRFKKKNLLLAFAILLFLAGKNVFPWWTQTHPYLSRLSETHFIRTLERTNLKAYYLDFRNAAIDPDEHKSLTHSNAYSRAQNAFNASIRLYNEGIRSNDNKKLRESVLNLGHSFHYLQDLGDPTKDIDDIFHQQRREDTRGIAQQMLQQTGNSWRQWLDPEALIVENSDFDGVLNRLNKMRTQQAQTIKNLFEDYKNNRNINLPDSLKMQLDFTFAAIVACQNRVIDLFFQQISANQPIPGRQQNYMVVCFSLKGYRFVYYVEVPDIRDINANVSVEYCLLLIRSVGFNYLQKRRMPYSQNEIKDIKYQLFKNSAEAAADHCQKEQQGFIPWLVSSCVKR